MSSLLLFVILAVGAVLLDGALSIHRERAAQEATETIARVGLDELGRGGDDDAIWQSLLAAAAERGIDIESAEYTDRRGSHLGARLGPADGDAIPDAAGGIHVVGRTRIDGFLATVTAATSFEIHTHATALIETP